MANAVRLEQLILKEISGVDSPANEAPGFAIFKSADGGTPAIVSAIAKAVATAVDEATDVAAAEVAQGMQKALAPYEQILGALLKRVESAEKLLASNARKSLAGQDDAPVIPAAAQPTLNDTMTHVLKGNSVTLTG